MDPKFKKWLGELDRVTVAVLGVTAGDCRDRCWRDHFDDGLTPKEAFELEFGDPDDPEGCWRGELFG